MHLYYQTLEARDSSQTVTGNLTAAIAVAGGAAVVLVIVICYHYLKRYRLSHDTPPSFIPTAYLQKRWMNWKIRGGPQSRRTNGGHLEPISQSATYSSQTARRSRQTAPTNAPPAQNASEDIGIDRNASVRSVMTLPAYRPKARDTEQVLGREGERGGMDVVLQFPDIAEQEEEERRDEEMEALYQVRLARREETAEREERRRLRQLARAGDINALEQLRRARAENIAANSDRNLETLREEHQRVRERQRAVSSVSYADLGVARHDGTRIRANSEESERPLLGDAASIATSSRHRRDRSVSSVVSVDTMNSDLPSPGFRRARPDSRGESPLRRVSGQATMSSPEMIDNDQDIASDGVPINSPPDYENIELSEAQEPPPGYSSPTDRRGRGFTATHIPHSTSSGQRNGRSPRAPSLTVSAVPSIVIETASPITTRPR